FCHLCVAQGLVARRAMMLRMFGAASASCASRRQGRRVAPTSAEELESFCQWRVAQDGWRVAPVS
ncbi:hypothetical protein A2U01_0060376, partial [Trifolium medium]|nr:hypothetical protein [Trifolium medium]